MLLVDKKKMIVFFFNFEGQNPFCCCFIVVYIEMLARSKAFSVDSAPFLMPLSTAAGPRNTIHPT